MNLREALKQLFGQTGATEDQVRAELHQLKIEGKLEGLMKEGLLAADPATQDAARVFLAVDPEAFDKLMRTPKPVPAQPGSTTIVQPTQSADPVEAQIAALVQEKQIPYHEAALKVSQGGAISTPIEGGTPNA